MRKLKLDELNRLSPEEFKDLEKFPISVVLDNIRSAHNVGSLFRTCDALACDHLYLTGITAQPPHKEITKTAIGATQSVSWSYIEDIEDCVSSLKDQGYMIIGIEQTTNSISLNQFDFSSILDRKVALVFGNEVQGISEAILGQLDAALEIPQFGTKHSFNVAVCAGIVIWEFVKRAL